MNTENSYRLGFWVILIIMLATLGALIWSMVEADPNTRSAIIAAFGIIFAVLITHNRTKNREIAARHFHEKLDGYMKFVGLFSDVIKYGNKKQDVPDEEIETRMLEFKKSLIVWGGAEVIKAWNRYSKEVISLHQQNTEEASGRILYLLNDILMLIRKDLGHNDTGLPEGSLIDIIIVEDGQAVVKQKN